jgi:tetratricopeptide (TPR) repeat protein
MAMALENLGALAPFEGDRPTSWSCHTQSLRIRREVGDKLGIATSTRFLAGLAFWDGDLATARHLNEECLTIHRELGNQPRVAEALRALAECARGEGAIDEARRLLEESVQLHREMGARQDLARSLCSLGEAAIADRDFPVARRALDESLHLADEIGHLGTSAWARAYLAMLGRAEGDWDGAAANVAAALDVVSGGYIPHLLATLADVVAGMAVARGDYEAAARLHGASDGLRYPPGSEAEPRKSSLDDDLEAQAVTAALGPDRAAALHAEGRLMEPADLLAMLRGRVGKG